VALTNRRFLETALTAALAAIGRDDAQSRVRASLLNLHFGEPRQHYEVWLRRPAGLIEVGLHFEGNRDDNLARLEAVVDAMPAVLAALGPAVEVEEWTETWTRIHETHPLDVLDEATALAIGERLAAYVRALEPLVAPFGPMAPTQPREGKRRGRQHRRKRRGAKPAAA
jgi:hypothetical protein